KEDLCPALLHDTHTPTTRPTGREDNVTKHPESGPQPLPARYLNPGLDAAALPRAPALGLEPGRSVPASGERLAAGLDDEVAPIDVRVLDAVGVKLELAVPPAVAPGLPHPLRGVEDEPVEVVVPHEPPLRGPCRGSGERRARGDGQPEQEAAHGDCFRYLQATIPAPVTFSSNAWLPLGSIAGMSCFCVATV